MKIAILLMGNIRTWAQCKLSFVNFYKHLNPDVFVTTYDIMYDYHPAVKANLRYFDDKIISESDIVSMFDDMNVKKIDIESDVDYSDYSKAHPKMNHETSFRQCRKFKRGIELIKEYETENKFLYDYVIKTRCDLLYNNMILQPRSECVINNDVGSVGVYPNDWIFTTNRADMEKMANFMLNEFFDYTNPTSGINPPHQLLHNAITHCNLTIQSLPLVHSLLRVKK